MDSGDQFIRATSQSKWRSHPSTSSHMIKHGPNNEYEFAERKMVGKPVVKYARDERTTVCDPRDVIEDDFKRLFSDLHAVSGAGTQAGSIESTADCGEFH